MTTEIIWCSVLFCPDPWIMLTVPFFPVQLWGMKKWLVYFYIWSFRFLSDHCQSRGVCDTLFTILRFVCQSPPIPLSPPPVTTMEGNTHSFSAIRGSTSGLRDDEYHYRPVYDNAASNRDRRREQRHRPYPYRRSPRAHNENPTVLCALGDAMVFSKRSDQVYLTVRVSIRMHHTGNGVPQRKRTIAHSESRRGTGARAS